MGVPLAFFPAGHVAAADIDELPQKLLSGHESYSPDWNQILDDRIKAGEPLPEWPDLQKRNPSIPADRAEPAEHLAFWQSVFSVQYPFKPTDEARRKILQAVRLDVHATADVIRFLPQDESSARIVAELLPQVPIRSDVDREKMLKARAWVYLHSGLLREEVIADCLKTQWQRYEETNGDDPSLHALRTRDPAEASRIFKTFMDGPDRGLAVLGTRLLLEMTPGEESYRVKLIAAAADSSLPEEAGEIAFECLLAQRWDGQDSWLLTSLGQEAPLDGHLFTARFKEEPERWIPILKEKLDKPGPVRDRCVNILLSLRRPDTIRLVLPWLRDYNWCHPAMFSFGHFMECLREMDIPECADGLMEWLAEDNPLDTKRMAADTLVHYRRTDAIPILKRLLAGPEAGDEQSRTSFVQAIQKLGGYEPEEIVMALEAYLIAYPGTDEYPERSGEPDSIREALKNDNPAVRNGARFAHPLLQTSPEVLVAIERRADAVEKANPVLAKNFRELAAQYFPAAAGRILAKELEAGRLGEHGLVVGLMYRRDENPRWDGKNFLDLAKQPGTAGGLASVLSGDVALMNAVLARGSAESQFAVLAATRITGDALDLKQLRKLVDSENETLADAARSILLRRADLPALEMVDEMQTERYPELRTIPDMFAKKGTDEDLVRSVFGISGAPAGKICLAYMPMRQLSEWFSVLFYPGRAFGVRYDGDGRRGISELKPEQIARLEDYTARYRIDDLPSMEMPVADGTGYRYEHVTPTRRRSVEMDNPVFSREALREYDDRKYSDGSSVYAGLICFFDDLESELDLKIWLGNGFEVLVPKERGHIKSVWKKGADLRVFVKSAVTEGAGFWQQVDAETGAILGAAEEPPDVPMREAWPRLFPGFADGDEPAIHPWQVRSGDALVHSGESGGVDGLWLCRTGKDPELLLKGYFHGERVSQDGKWCLVVRREGREMSEAQKVIRIRMETKETFPVDLEDAGSFTPVAFIRGTGKFMVRRARQPIPASEGERLGPVAAEYHLVDPVSGSVELVKGNFLPLKEKQPRPLQATANPVVVWASQTEEYRDAPITRVGLYDTGDFKFLTAREIKGIGFTSSDMWVDEEQGIIYAVIDGDLVKIPLGGK